MNRKLDAGGYNRAISQKLLRNILQMDEKHLRP